MAEVHYDTPWEFTCRAPLPKPTVSMTDALVDDAVKRAPACGVAARRHNHRSGQDGIRLQRNSSAAPDNNRSTLTTSSNEYDMPWDLKKRPAKPPPVRPCSAIYDRVWEARSGSPTVVVVGGEQQTDLTVKVNKAVSVSKEEVAGGEKVDKGDKMDKVDKVDKLDKLDRMDKVGQPPAKGASDVSSAPDRRRLVEQQRSPRGSPLVETVFCSKALPSPPLVETRAEMRNRFIQQVCGGNTLAQVSPMVASRGKKGGRRPKLSNGVDVVRMGGSISSQLSHSSQASPPSQRLIEQSSSLSLEKDTRIPLDAQSVETTSTASKQSSSSTDEYDVPWEFCNRNKLNRLQARRENGIYFTLLSR